MSVHAGDYPRQGCLVGGYTRSVELQLILADPDAQGRESPHSGLSPAQAILRQMVLDSVQSPHSRRNYAKALDHLFAFCASRPLSRALLMEWRAGMEALSPSTVALIAICRSVFSGK
jgi:hypothetical protein